MLIGGFVPFSLIDYPPHTACVVFAQGCNFRCPYCHNPELIIKGAGHRFLPRSFFDFLSERRGKLDAVVVTGGEPTMQDDLIEFVGSLGEMGFAVKIDTNGTNPAVLERLVGEGRISAVAMDVKAPLERYGEVTGAECDEMTIAAIHKSITLLLNSKIEYEFRTTTVKGFLTPDDILAIGNLIRGADRYALQHFVPTKTYDPRFANAVSFSDRELEELKQKLEQGLVKKVILR